MPISSFYGLQTSLRGLLAQQRALDTTGHNIANASTQGYSRQEATLVASPALEIPAGGIASGAGAHLGSGVDVQSFGAVAYRSQPRRGFVRSARVPSGCFGPGTAGRHRNPSNGRGS